jgi:hypothetical protein
MAENSLWDKIGDKIHLGLGVAGMVPGIGNIADLIDAGIYTAEGDKLGAGLALAAAVPGMGLAAGGTKLLKGAKNLKKAKKNITSNVDTPPIKSQQDYVDFIESKNKEALEKFGVDAVKDNKGFNAIQRSLLDKGIGTDADLLKVGHLSKMGDLDAVTVDMAKEALKKELLTPESYGKWSKMMDANQSIMLKKLQRMKAPQKMIDEQISRQNNLFLKRDYDHYKDAMNKILDKTEVYRVPVKSPAHMKPSHTGNLPEGWWSSNTGNIYISENVGNVGSTLIHEFKHAVQGPYKEIMDEVFENSFQRFNKNFRNTLSPQRQILEEMKPSLIKQREYLTDPMEVSARLSEIRAKNLGYTGSKRATRELEQVFDSEKVEWLKKNVWAAAPIGMMTNTERIQKVFSEEEE